MEREGLGGGLERRELGNRHTHRHMTGLEEEEEGLLGGFGSGWEDGRWVVQGCGRVGELIACELLLGE